MRCSALSSSSSQIPLYRYAKTFSTNFPQFAFSLSLCFPSAMFIPLIENNIWVSRTFPKVRLRRCRQRKGSTAPRRVPTTPQPPITTPYSWLFASSHIDVRFGLRSACGIHQLFGHNGASGGGIGTIHAGPGIAGGLCGMNTYDDMMISSV